jgi:hypothetical protein
MADGRRLGQTVESEGPAVEFEEYEEPGLGFDLAVVGGVFVVGALTGGAVPALEGLDRPRLSPPRRCGAPAPARG